MKKSSQKRHEAQSTDSLSRIKAHFASMRQRISGVSQAKQHKSFRRTYRRDYARALPLPGYWAMTFSVVGMLRHNKRLFGLLALTYALLTSALVGIASQDVYSQVSDTFRQFSGTMLGGQWSAVTQTTMLLGAALGGSFSGTLTDVQWVYECILLLMVWLTTIWLLRAVLAGRTPKLRDGIYHSGAPIVPTFLIGLVLFLQLIPAAIAALGLYAALPSGILDSGVAAMLLSIAGLLLVVLSLYWITSTLVALVVVTLPGMYPFEALRTAAEIVSGRRIRILLRLLWVGLTTLTLWLVAMLPVVLIDAWIKSMWPAVRSVPIVPLALLAVSSLLTIWAASYVYLLYRKVVDSDAAA